MAKQKSKFIYDKCNVNKYDTIIDYTVRLTPFHQVSICCDKSTQIICTFIICLAVYTSHFLYDILD